MELVEIRGVEEEGESDSYPIFNKKQLKFHL